jgi:hypothetical protein
MKKNYTLLLLFSLPAFTASFSQALLNPSFESWGSSTACEVNVTPDSWVNYSNAGLEVDEANFSYCPTTIPPAPADGNVYARSYGASTASGEGFYQIVNGFTPGSSYLISYSYSGSNLYGGTDPVQWHTFIDDQDVNTSPVFQSTDAVWTLHNYVFVATSASHKIGFRLYSTTGNSGSGAMDHVDVSETTALILLPGIKGIAVYPSIVSDVLHLDLNRVENTNIVVYSSLGQQVASLIPGGDKVTLDVTALEKGIYFVRISTDKEVVVKRFVKE